MLASLSYRDFRWMLAGSFASFLGMSMQMITRGWLVLRLEDDSPFALAMVMISFSLPMTFVSLLGGALADRLARKHLIIISQAGNAVMTVFLGVLDMNGTVAFWHIFVFGLVNGSLMAFNMPSRQAMLSEIVPEKNLMNAISLNSAVMNLTGIAGPAAAGFLILFVDTSGVFFIVGAIYVLSVILTMALNAGNSPVATSRNGIAGDIKEGLSYAAADSGRLGLLALMLITTLFGFSYWALMPAWAREALDVQSDGLGILMAIMGIGSLVGTLGLAAVPHSEAARTAAHGSRYRVGRGAGCLLPGRQLHYGDTVSRGDRRDKRHLDDYDHDHDASTVRAPDARPDDEHPHDGLRRNAPQRPTLRRTRRAHWHPRRPPHQWRAAGGHYNPVRNCVSSIPTSGLNER